MPGPVRVYVPATMATLAALLAEGSARSDLATAVTDDLRSALPGLDDEELELEAMLDAADLSLGLVQADPSIARRRVVVAADVPGTALGPADGLGAAVVRVAEAISLDQVASVHVDEPSAEARVALGDVGEVDLLWYAPQEIADLLSG